MAIRRKYISVKKEVIQALCKELNVHRSSVYSALNYTSNSETAQQIRRLAITTYGGVEATKVIW